MNDAYCSGYQPLGVGVAWRGAPWRIVRLIEDGLVEAYATEATIAELRRVLQYARLQPRQREMRQTPDTLLSAVMRMSFIIAPVAIQPVITADPKDDIFLACALAAGAQYLVSGDSHLLDLGQWRGIEMVTVNAFLAQHFPEDTTQ